MGSDTSAFAMASEILRLAIPLFPDVWIVKRELFTVLEFNLVDVLGLLAVAAIAIGVVYQTVIGRTIVGFVSGAHREAAAVVNGILVVATIGIWFVSAPMAARFLLLLLTGLSLATPTFGSGN